jgi:glutamine---fructose-6-phosphate transaminase (isomerizing)
MKTNLSPDNNPFLADILAQPATLRRVLENIDLAVLLPVADALRRGAIQRIVLTGMGSSLYALYPAWLRLADAGLPAVWVDAAELLHAAPGLLTPGTLLWVASQSGWSAEIVTLLDRVRRLSNDGRSLAGLVAIVNDLESPLAHAASPDAPAVKGGLDGVLLPLHAGPEGPLTAHTFLNTLAVAGLAAETLCIGMDRGRTNVDWVECLENGKVLSSTGAARIQASLLGPAVAGALDLAFCQVEQAAGHIEAYLAEWPAHLEKIGAKLGAPDKIVLLGRGASLAVVYNTAMCIHEAARLPALPLHAAEFRHGPIEMTDASLSAVVLAGEGPGRELNRRLYAELRQKGARAAWLDPLPAGDETTGDPGALPAPEASGLALSLAEAVPLQLACLHLALQAGLTPGEFRHIGKVTLDE